jgi:hypothetical protein
MALGFYFSANGVEIMNEVWIPVIAMAGINLLAVAAMWGGLGQRVKESERRITDLEDSDEDQWRSINSHGQTIAVLEDRAKSAAAGAD